MGVAAQPSRCALPMRAMQRRPAAPSPRKHTLHALGCKRRRLLAAVSWLEHALPRSAMRLSL